MGNTGSSNNDVKNEYNYYDKKINDYKMMIMSQQSQINQLSTMNINQNIKNRTTANMFFNDIQKNSQNNPYSPPNSQFNTVNMNLLENNKTKLNPYKILGIDKNFDEVILKKAYLKKALKAHPDRGGTNEEFQKVSIAYTLLLKKLNDLKNNNSHNDLRDNSKQYVSEQQSNPRENVEMTENFDINLFNKVYNENKIDTPYDDGYGTWMGKNEGGNMKTEKIFSGNFNKNLFNHEFEKHKKVQQQQNRSQLIVYDNPEVSISYKGKDSLQILGQGKITDFSGDTSGGLNYRDYKDAFTNTCLIDVNSFQDNNRDTNIDSLELSRSNISYQLSEQDQKKYMLSQLNDKKNEDLRQSTLQKNDTIAFNTYDKIHQRLLNR